jgi:hypothetical protein
MSRYCREYWNLIHSLEEFSEAINVTRLVTRFRGRFDFAAWGRSIDRLVTRHPILSARVAVDSGGLEFVVDEDYRPQLRIVDAPSFSSEDPRMALGALTDSLTWEKFDPEEGRLFRAFAIMVSDLECVLGIVAHHGISDGWSMEIIGRELLIGYVAEISGRRPPVPERYTDYLDHNQWMDEWLKGAEARSQASYWTRQLANSPNVRLPIRREFNLDVRAPIATEYFKLDLALVRDLRRRAGNVQTTPSIMLLTANIAALSAVIASHDIAVVVLVEQRSDPKLRHTVGLLLNWLPIRTAVNSDDSFDELAARVRQMNLGAFSNHLHPYLLAEVQRNAFPWFRFRRLIPEGSGRGSGDAGFAPFDLPERPPVETSARRYGCAGYGLDIEHRGGVMHCRVNYLPTIYLQETIARYVQTFCTAVELVANASDRPVSTLLHA